jgi:hypothetical protein
MRIIASLILLLSMLACMGLLCDMSSHNGPINNDSVDTTTIQHLTSPVTINISVLVRELDSTGQELISSKNTTINFFSTGEKNITDVTGYVKTSFNTDTMPFKYSYEVVKNGYKKVVYTAWENKTTISNKITIYKEN